MAVTMTPFEIKALRQRLGWSQQKFANELKVGLMTVSRWERSKTKPSPLALEKLKQLKRSVETGKY
jgi:putative transcriptional regulator